ncbi:hypothetical protein [Geotalea sp. SG265]|uniref:hypothetical protein n=1 Tax=Geotalea sp. SG265 TaxID=2922867 RepID=UPI001FAF0289|nr:hypothetical protein [Geotalea sp. SG265]
MDKKGTEKKGLQYFSDKYSTRPCTKAEIESQRLLGETLTMIGVAVEKKGMDEMPASMSVIESYGLRKYPQKKSIFPPCPDKVPLNKWIGKLYWQIGMLLIAAAKKGQYAEKPYNTAQIMLGPVN